MKIEFLATVTQDNPSTVSDLAAWQERLYAAGVPENATIFIRKDPYGPGVLMRAEWAVEVEQ